MGEDVNTKDIVESCSENEIMQIRREKLDSLKQKGINPFDVTSFSITTCAKEILENI